jgi:hypothetical protein
MSTCAFWRDACDRQTFRLNNSTRYIVGKKDRTVHPDLERAMATCELDSSHVPMLSQPERVLDVIRNGRESRSRSHGSSVK